MTSQDLIHAINEEILSPGFLSWGRPDPMWYIRKVLECLRKHAITSAGVFNTIVIGITGRAGSGKDTAIRLFEEIYNKEIVDDVKVFDKAGLINPLMEEYHFKHMAFAEPLKEIAQIMGFTKDQLYSPVKKNLPDEFWGISPRQFLQMCGTEMFRNVWRDDVWVRVAEKRIDEFKRLLLKTPSHFGVVFVTDVRFPNECDVIHQQNGIVIRINRDGVSQMHHASEDLVGSLPVDLEIKNNASSAEAWAVEFTTSLIKHFDKSAFFN